MVGEVSASHEFAKLAGLTPGAGANPALSARLYTMMPCSAQTELCACRERNEYYTCFKCNKTITDCEYVVNWGSCSECFSDNYMDYLADQDMEGNYEN